MTIRSRLLTVLALGAASSPFDVSAFSLETLCRRSFASTAGRDDEDRPLIPIGNGIRDPFVVRRASSHVTASASVVNSIESEESNDTDDGGNSPRRESPANDAETANAPRRRSATARKVKAPRFVQAAHQQRQQQQQQQQQQMPQIKEPSSQQQMPVRPLREAAEGREVDSTVSAPRPSMPKLDKDQMWRRSKTIEELESTLMARWGADARQWTDYDDADDENDDHEGGRIDQGGSGESASALPAVRARPVYDPWGVETKPPAKDRESSNFRVSDLIRDKPVGGVGVRQPVTAASAPTKPAAATNPGFFFRPPPQPTLEEDVAVDSRAAMPESSSSKRSVSSEAPTRVRSAPADVRSGLQRAGRADDDDNYADDERTSRSSPPPPSRPLVDERDGVTPLFLTIEQALRNYEEARMAVPQNERTDEEDASEISEVSPSVAQPSWTELGVTSPTLLANLRRMECIDPLPVQRQMLEYLLSPTQDSALTSELTNDVICGTMTGSGKTLSFLVPLVQRLVDHMELSPEDNSSPPQVLVVAPGRELASQIVSVARDLLQDTGLGVQLAIGGTTFARNLEAIRKRKPHIIVGTPGRLAELVAGRPGEAKGRLAKIFRPSTLVMDEFDALLEYKPHREKSLALLQVLRRDPHMQTIVCSATASDMMREAGAGESTAARPQSQRPLIDDYLRPGYRVAMAQSSDVLTASGAGDGLVGTRVSRTVIHGVVHVPHRRFALETLRRILHTDPLPQQVLVFVKDSHKVKIVVERLERDGIIAAPLSGDDDKMDRADVSRALREGYVGLVVATELAARGLDAPLLTHVINLDLPTDASHYAHRAGRCGRGNRPGVVINVTTMPQERSVPRRLADKLGVDMYTVEVRNGKLNIVDPSSQTLDSR